MGKKLLARVGPVLALVWLVGGGASTGRGADLVLTPERYLIGRWQTAAGEQVLTLWPAERLAVLEVTPGGVEGATPDPRFGHYTVHQSLWVMTVVDIDGRQYPYGIVPQPPNRLNLVDATGALITFERPRVAPPAAGGLTPLAR